MDATALQDGTANLSELRDDEYNGRIKLITSYEYDLLGNRTKVVEPKGFADGGREREAYTTAYGYDILNRLETITRQYNGSDATVKYFYDEVGNKIREINQKGHETTYAYDSMNRLIAMTDAMGETYEYGYDAVGNRTTETNPKGHTITYTYDKLNRPETVIDPYGITISTKEYDKTGNVIKETDGKGYVAVYAYDLAGQVKKRTDSEGGVTSYEYSQYGELVQYTDGLGNSTRYEYEIGGNLVKVTDALGIATKYTYDKAGNKLTMTDGRGKTTQYGYGSFGLLLSYTDAEGQETAYRYDLVLNTAGMRDRNGNETLYAYDNKGLLTERRVAATGDAAAYTYDVMGNRESMTDATGTSSYSYNENNWLLLIEKDGEPLISYAYDEIGNITSVTDKLGNRTEYTYDKSSRMETVSFDGGTATYAYDENGNRESFTYSSGVEETYTYDKNNRLLKLENRKANGNEISRYSYTYDKAGRQVTKTDSFGTTKYTYDKAGRVQKGEAPGKTTYYAYDNAGNRISQDETYTSEQVIPAVDGMGMGEIKYIVKRSEYVYSNANKLLKLVEKLKDAGGKEQLQKITTVRYDGNGNEIRRSMEYVSLYNRANPKAYNASAYGEETTEPIHVVVEQTVSRYDGFNRLAGTEVIKGGVRTVVEYTYNGDDLREKKTVKQSDKGYAAEETSYLYDRQHVILETRDSESISYVRGINYIARSSGGNTSYFMYNGHGDVVQTVSEDGNIENQYDYDIFGNPTLTVESYSCAIRYAGEFYDAETGLYYLRARYYDPYTGRFISEDSYWGEDVNPLSLNLYTYCSNDPIQHIDPTGHWEEGDEKLSKEAQEKIKKLTETYNSAKAAGSLETAYDAHLQAEKIRKEDGKTTNSPVSPKDDSGSGGGSSSEGKNRDRDSDKTKKTVTWEGYVVTVDIDDPLYSNWASYKGNAYAPNMYISSDTEIDEMNVAAGSKVNIQNRGYIGTINTGEGSHTIIGNDGKIGTINTGIGSYAVITNTGTIKIVNTGADSHTEIRNRNKDKDKGKIGDIGEIRIGAGSVMDIQNDGHIRSIYTGDKALTYMYNSSTGTIDEIVTGIESENYIEDYGVIVKGVTTGMKNHTFFNSKNGIVFNKGEESYVVEMTLEQLREIKGTFRLDWVHILDAEEGTGNTYVTKQNLVDIGWNTDEKYLNDDMVKELNSMLIKYGITKPGQIYHFLSQVMKESDDWYKKGLGDGVIELGSDSYISGRYEGRKGLGNTQKGDGILFKGAGYLHLTGRSNYTAFYNYMKSQSVDDPSILSQGYKTISEKYAWESSAWYWSIARPSLNTTSLKQGTIVTRTVNDDGKMVTVTGNSTVFDVTKLVNGGTNGISDRIKYYNLVKEKIKF